MIFSPNQIIALLAFPLVYVVWKIISNTNKNKNNNEVPEPSGALPIIGHLHLLGGRNPVAKILGAMADVYGPIFSLRVGKYPTLVVSGWEIVKECFGATNDKILSTRPNIAIGRYVGYDNAAFALSPYGQYWRDVRKLATLELLSPHRLDDLRHVRDTEVNTFIKELHSLCVNNIPFEVAAVDKLFGIMTFNIAVKMIAGKRYSAGMYGEKDSEAWRLKSGIEKALYLSGVFVMADAIPSLEWLDFGGHVRSMKKTSKELDLVLGKWLDEHVQKKIEGKSDGKSDLIDAMLANIEDPVMSGHTRDNVIKATAMILVFTGSESTAVTLTWALSLLLNHPSVLKLAREELDTNVGRDKWVQESDIKNLKYLQAIVKETLRLFPPGPVTPREAMEDCHIAGYFVPKGTRLIANIWKLHRDPRVWSDPDLFQPDRFLTSHADVDVKGLNFEYIPFGSGRRGCPGMALGLQVVHLTLARLLHAFDITTIGGKPVDMSEGLGIALPKVKPLDVVLTPRLPLELYQGLSCN